MYPKRPDLESLLAVGPGPRSSLLMPTHGPGLEESQDRIRYQRLARVVGEELARLEISRADRDRIVQRLSELTAPAGFWREQAAGLAVYVGAEGLWSLRLPLEPDELAVVGTDFQIAPLVPLLDPPRFWIVAVSRSGVRLYEASAYEIEEMPLTDAPTGFEEITQYYELEKQLQFRQAATAGRGRQVAMFHGHGIGEIRDRELVLQYLRAVDRSVRRALPGPEAPLVVCGPSEVPGLYRQVSHHAGLIGQHLEIHPEGAGPAELHARALGLVGDVLEAPLLEATRRWDALVGTGKTAATLQEMLPAASQGRIDTLLVPPHQLRWGRFDADSGKVETHDEQEPGDAELVNLAVAHTLRHGGRAVASPERGLGAIFRY